MRRSGLLLRWPGTCGLQGLRVELDASGSAFGKQFKRADRSGARWALVLGDDEAERGEVRLKALQQQAEESTVAILALCRRDRGETAAPPEDADPPRHWRCRLPWLPSD